MLKFVADIRPEALPSQADFDPWDGDLDAQSAWREFGGLTIEEAYAKFWEAPDVYQEDFMSMGTRAFHYYFPVVDEYLRSVKSSGESDDCCAPILGYCVAAQCHPQANLSPALRNMISELCEFVLSSLARYAWVKEDEERTRTSWLEVRENLRGGEVP